MLRDRTRIASFGVGKFDGRTGEEFGIDVVDACRRRTYEPDRCSRQQGVVDRGDGTHQENFGIPNVGLAQAAAIEQAYRTERLKNLCNGGDFPVRENLQGIPMRERASRPLVDGRTLFLNGHQIDPGYAQRECRCARDEYRRVATDHDADDQCRREGVDEFATEEEERHKD